MTKEHPERETLNIAEVQRILGCGRNQAYQTVKENDLAIRVGKNRLLVPRIRLDRFLGGQR